MFLKLFVFSVLALALAPPAFSSTYLETNPSSTSVYKVKPRKARTKRWELLAGGAVYQYDYKEDVPLPLKSMEKGAIPGATLSARFRVGNEPESVEIQSILDIAGGSTTYDGSIANSKGLYMSDATTTTNNSFLNFESDARFNFLTVTPNRSYLRGYTGLGFHAWNRDITGGGGYEEDYAWAYLPLGLRYETKITDKFEIAFDAAIKFMLLGTIDIHYSEVLPGASDVQTTLGNKPGYKFQIPIGYRFNPTLKVVLAPFFEYSEIGQSDSAYIITGSKILSIYEPSSRTYQYGSTLSMAADL